MNNTDETQIERGDAKTYVILMIGIAALAFSAPFTKLSNFNPETATILRCGIGVIAMFPFVIRELKLYGKFNKKGVGLCMIAGFFLGIDFTAWNYSTYYVGSGIASILLNIQVIILPALAFFIDKEKIPSSYLFVAPTLLFGVILSGGALEPLIFGTAKDVVGPTHIYGYTLAFLGTVCGLISGCCYGIYLYTTRKAGRINNKNQFVTPIFISSASQLIAPIVLILIGFNTFDLVNGVLVNETGMLPHNPETTPGSPITAINWMWMLILGVFSHAIAWTFTQYGSIRLNPTIVAGLLILSPVATVAIIAPLMFGESLSWLQVVGVIITLLTVAYQNGLISALFKKIKGN
ncbi:MAG: DMT family transporter [Campylobacter sp.]|nr:DMT family transporter [Campylobacter sp.]